MAKNKFYKFKNLTDTNQELYVYGVIVGGADKWDESDVTFKDFKDTLEKMTSGSTLNMYINSPGGDVFTTQSSIAMIRRAKERGVKINAYIDGLAASCGSWLPMIADKIFIYPQSIMMIHKPLCMVYGNSDEMQKEIEVLDKIENDVIIPLYMEKAKDGVTEETIREKMANETWLNANEIQEMFNVTLLEDERKIACCVDKDIFNNYSNVPESLLKIANELESEDNDNGTEIDLEDNTHENKKDSKERIEVLEQELEKVNSEKEELAKNKVEIENKLNEANEKIIALNEEITSMKPLVEQYNKLQDEKKVKEEEETLKNLIKDYENKFDMLNASKKFRSDKVQNLIKEAVKDESKKNEINSIIVELIQINNKTNKKNVLDSSVDMNNLIEFEEDGATKYGFK